MMATSHLLRLGLAWGCLSQGEVDATAPVTILDYGVDIVDMAVDASAQIFVIMDKDRLISGRKLDKPQVVLWRHLAPPAQALECTAGALVVSLKLPYAEVFDVRTGERLAPLDGPKDVPVAAFVAGERGKVAWVGAGECIVEMPQKGQWKRLALGNAGVSSLAIDGDSRWLAAGGRDGQVHLIDLENLEGEKTARRCFESAITSMVFMANQALLVGSESGEVAFFDRELRQERFRLQAGLGRVNTLILGPKAKWFALGSEGGVISVRSMTDGEELSRASAGPECPVHAMAYVENDKRIWFAAGPLIKAMSIRKSGSK